MISYPSSRITVALVDDRQDMRETFADILRQDEALELVAIYVCGEEACQQLPGRPVDVVLMDIDLPDRNGIECVHFLKPKMPRTEFIMLSVMADDESIFSALKAGATGYLNKDVHPEKLHNAIREALRGCSPLSGRIARRVVSSFRATRPPVDRDLTETERRVFRLLCLGKTYRDIAAEAFVSVNTVKFHLKKIYLKLGVKSRAEAMLLAHND